MDHNPGDLIRLTIDGAPLSIQAAGSGPGLVFVHGSLGDYRSWRRQIGPFSKAFRAVAYSRRGHYPGEWHSSWPEYTAGLHAADLAGLIEALDLAPAILVGSSYGALTALLLAVQRPEIVRGLVLGEPPLIPWLADRPDTRPLSDAFLRHSWEPAGAACAAGDLPAGIRLFLDGVNGPGFFERMSPLARASVLDNASEFAAETRSTRIYPPLTRVQVAGLRVPALLLSGADSPAMFHAILRELASCLPDAARARIPRANHTIHQGNPAAYQPLVMDWLNGLP